MSGREFQTVRRAAEFPTTESAEPVTWDIRPVVRTFTCTRVRSSRKQVAVLSQRGRAMLRVIEYFANSLKVIQNDTVEYGVCSLSPY